MDDDEEIDIIGTFDEISSGQLLSCDDPVFPNWTNSEGNSFWNDSVPKSENLESNVKVLHSEEIVIEKPEPVRQLIDSEWTEEPIMSPNDLIFEEDIPASIEEVVSNQEEIEEVEGEEEEGGEEGEEEEYNDDANDSSFEHDQISQDTEYDQVTEIYSFEPAAFETHPPDRSAKYIGPTNERSILKVKIESQPSSIAASSTSDNILMNNETSNARNAQKPPSKFKTKLKVNSKFFKISRKAKIPFSSNKINNKIGKFAKQSTLPKLQMTKPQQNLTKVKTRSSSLSGKVKKSKRKTETAAENITISHEAEKKNLAMLDLGTVVKVDKCDTESDIEIDIEDLTTNDDEILLKGIAESLYNASNTSVEDNKSKLKHRSNHKDNEEAKVKSRMKDLSDRVISDDLKRQLKDMSKPQKEMTMNTQEVLEIEKYVNYEFFNGRLTKTPEQYLRIRNHILSMWNAMKPNYISKTSVRNGLKHGGDVNCISRIHRLLEQIGAINFGHEGQYFDYIRPLEDFISMYAQQVTTTTTRNRNDSNPSSNNISTINLGMERRQRVRSQRFTSFSGIDYEANYTIIHMDGVVRPEPPRLNADKSIPIYKHIKSEYDLVKCLKFSKENLAPFKVSITLSTLLCLQLHSFSSNHEVMGFIGGYCSKSVGRNKISLTRYKPCRTSQQSSTMCEMCPVSQVEQSSSLGAEGFELLGWFHSHPSFPATPSRTDIRTQKEMQQQFSIQNDRPFVGLILSCVNLAFKCIYILPNNLHSDLSDNELAYELDVDIIKDCTNFKNDVTDVLIALEMNCDTKHEVINKFKNSSGELLNRFGYDTEIFYNNIF